MRKLKGFTLIELLVVVAIIGILATVVVVNLSSSQNKARISKVQSDISEIANAAEIILTDTSTFSGNSASLNTIVATRQLYALLGSTTPATTNGQASNQNLTVGQSAVGNLNTSALAATNFKDASGTQLIPSIPTHPSGAYTVIAAVAPATTTATGYGYFWQGNAAGSYSVFAPDPANLGTKVFSCTTGRNCTSTSNTASVVAAP